MNALILNFSDVLAFNFIENGKQSEYLVYLLISKMNGELLTATHAD